ncbi:branched-chain amino acid transaminase [Thalassomonas haliotis]|uniref:Branched-chain-amino-acid aminotransferase n=1 Tax=Thalassomonas haliotis TaxID=485448 RepID=A0ABY7VDP8_9GAMM|nr:branched-chain amino acid transaminase [Thalassomonas haliotis]WDE11839.1 branched-chain amino acid transaminase [Thalassomonas haliotis]
MEFSKAIWLNGVLVHPDAAMANIFSHGLHYGTTVFEGERIYQGKVFRLTDHSARLLKSAELLGFEIPYSVKEINQATQDLVTKLQIKQGYVRPVAWLGEESLALMPDANKVNVAIAAWDWPDLFDQEKRQLGVRLGFTKWIKHHPEAVPVAAKAGGNYLNSCLALSDVRARGFDEALMLDYEGYIAEATGANIFFVKGERLITPQADRFLNGITRQTVCHIAETLGLVIEEKRINVSELEQFDGAFLCGTAYEILPVRHIDQYQYEIPQLTQLIINNYQALCNQGWD